MKVNIGPYKQWFGPFQIAEKILFWKEGGYAEDNVVFKFGNWLAYDKHGDPSWLHKVCVWIYDRRKRSVKIQIDRYDTWSMDHTLALIILPMLKQLKQNQHGAPNVDDEDVPAKLRSTSAPKKKDEYAPDNNHFKRWEWVLDEIIFAFEDKASDDEAAIKIMQNSKRTKTGALSKETLKKLEKHSNRVKNGLRLFGKYYSGLWD